MEPLSPSPINKPFKIQDKKTRPHEEKPAQVYKKTDPVQESPRKDIRATQESKNPKIERVASQKILQQYKESPNEPDMDEAGIEEISQALDRFILPLNKNSVFSDTDLVLIDSAFSGNMPLNGIRKSELEHIEQLFKSICEGKEKLKISADNAPFTTQTEEAIKLLLTRNIGRKLIQKILENPLLNKVEILRGENSKVTYKNANVGEIKITMTTLPEDSKDSLLSYHPTGKIMLRDNPFYITLAHEMVHVSHYPNLLASNSPTLSSKYNNMEEQLTITGLKKDLSLENPEYDFKENYDELNEWNITAAFTNSQNVFFPRFSHLGMSKNFFPLNADNIERIKSAEKSEGIERKNLLYDIEDLVQLGVLYDLEELYKLNIIDISKLFENRSPPLIYSALLSGDVKMVRFLMNKGFDINQNAADYFFKEVGFSLLPQHSEMIEFIVENRLSTHAAFLKLDLDYMDPSNGDEYKALLKLIFKDYLKSPDSFLPRFWFISKLKLGSNREKSMGILLDCVSENIQEFLTEIHNLDEYKKKGEYFDNIALMFEKLGFDTTHLKNTLSELYRKKKDL